MIALKKLSSLSPDHRRRKIALSLETIEHDVVNQEFRDISYLNGLISLLMTDTELSKAFRDDAKPASRFLQKTSVFDSGELFAVVNRLRRNLDHEIGRDPADWDFQSRSGTLDPLARRIHPGLRAYLEDVRSPFNVGSIFRTADALGVEELPLSRFCADPGHPRAERVAMGTTAIVRWRRTDASQVQTLGPLVALELKGTPLHEFDFPKQGVLVVGSEELGISPALLARCENRVSIPMLGSKASMNVATAFGIAMYVWGRSLHKGINRY